MINEIKVPSPGESVTMVEIGRWLVEDGALVRKDQEIAEIESDKAALTIVADAAGKISIKAKEGTTVPVGSTACTIDTSFEVSPDTGPDNNKQAEAKQPATPPSAPEKGKTEEKREPGKEALKITSVAREIMKEQRISVEDLLQGLKRIGKKELETFMLMEKESQESASVFSREETRERMTPLRRKLSERLVSVKNETAMLTTFNEADMSSVLSIRKMYQVKFAEKHGVRLGFMALFTKAVAIALRFYPSVNSFMDGEEIVTPEFADIGIAVQSPRGLMVPVVRNAESKSIAQIEMEIRELAEKARNKRITLDELAGGTFTITNGGVFGSMMSTPIINPPQSAILGMHKIMERPVAVAGKVEIRPMMYLALTYDHRVIDGKDSVGFLVKVKEMIETPGIMLSLGKDPLETLLGI